MPQSTSRKRKKAPKRILALPDLESKPSRPCSTVATAGGSAGQVLYPCRLENEAAGAAADGQPNDS
jgi:hypothetical protein